jgi:ElaB/YqjD/DUF883 family membrane-anchored ribosome-binding protein
MESTTLGKSNRADAAVNNASISAHAAVDAAQKKLAADTCSYVKADPLKAIGIAVVAGVLLGRFIR